MLRVLMISMDDSILTGALGDNRARHEEYARRAGGPLRIVICTTKALEPLHTDLIHAVPTLSRSRLAYLIDGMRVARDLCAEIKPDVITTQDPLLTGLIGLQLRAELNIPVIVQDHTTIADGNAWARESLRNRMLQRLARFVLPRADAVRVVNNGEREACMRIGVEADRVHVLPVATDLAHFAKPTAEPDWRARLGLRPDQPMALWVGRPVPFKNLPLLFAAFGQVHAALPEAVLVLAGDFSGTDYPERITVMGLQDAVKLAGKVSFAELPALYQTANVYVHSSFYEGLPRVQVEAAAAGLPIISTDVTGVRDLVTPGVTGWLIPLEPEPFAEAMIRLLRDPEQARTFGVQGQKDVLVRFDPDRLIDGWVGLWKNVAAAGSRNQSR